MDDLGSLIRARRVALGLTLQDLAERAGVAAPNLSRIERGVVDPRASTVERLCRALGVDPWVGFRPPSATTLEEVARRAEAGRRRLAAAGVASPAPWDRLAWRAGRGQDVRQEAARLAESTEQEPADEAR